MAEKISSSKYELIQETIANPEFKSKLSNILKEMSANDLASLIQNSPPQERKIIWDSIELEYEGEVLGELDEQLRDELLKEMEPEEISLAISDLEVDDLVDIYADKRFEYLNSIGFKNFLKEIFYTYYELG